jgi:hypothetical protein
LAAGGFRLILAVDRATPELRNIVELVNRRSVDDLEGRRVGCRSRRTAAIRGQALGWSFSVFAVIVLLARPLVRGVPEHRESWCGRQSRHDDDGMAAQRR